MPFMRSNFRRNKEGDRDKALETVLQIVETATDRAAVSPDVLCLAGRIYKDKFIGSNYEDKESLERAIQWWVAFWRFRFSRNSLKHFALKQDGRENWSIIK